MLCSLGSCEYCLPELGKNLPISPCILGSSTTATLVSLIANAGKADQAIATSGNQSLSCLSFTFS